MTPITLSQLIANLQAMQAHLALTSPIDPVMLVDADGSEQPVSLANTEYLVSDCYGPAVMIGW